MSGCRSETEQLLGARHVGLRDLGGAREATGQLRRLLLQLVAQAGLLTADLARPGHPEALARTGVRLVLRHLCVSSSARGWSGRSSCPDPCPAVIRVDRLLDRGVTSSRLYLRIQVLGASALLLLCGGPRVGRLVLGAFLVLLGLAGGGLLLARRLHLGLRLGLLAVRSEHHDHVA